MNQQPNNRNWQVVLTPSANRALDRLPIKISLAVAEFTFSSLKENPKRVGHPLHLDLIDYWTARHGAYRIIYQIDEERKIVFVVRISHRADIYRSE